MKYPNCGIPAKVRNSLELPSGSRWRVYRCQSCGDLIETTEKIVNVRRPRKYERKNTKVPELG